MESMRQAGLDVDTFAPTLSFFFNVHNDFFGDRQVFVRLDDCGRVKWNGALSSRILAHFSSGAVPRPQDAPSPRNSR